MIYGFYEEDIYEVAEMLGANLDDPELDAYEFLANKLDDTCLVYGTGEGICWVGRSYWGIEDDETGKQFKDSVEADVKRLFGDNVKCAKHEGVIYG
jgi:hypothetical protein